MGNRELKKEIERLEDDLSNASRKIEALKIAKNAYEDEIRELRADLAETRGKYTTVLEKYIAMMEARVKE